MHTHTCMLNMINMDASMLAAICNFYTCVGMHVCVYACMCVHVVTPPMPPDAPDTPHPPAPSPEPQVAQNTKIQ